MADNVQLPVTGTGTADIVAATDDVAGVHYPFVKLADGTLGGTAAIGGDATNGLDVDVTRVTGTVATGGDTAHDSADAGNPVAQGLNARTTNPTAVADGDRVRAIADDVGRAVVVVSQVRDLVVQATTTISNTTETTVLAAGAAGVFHDVTCIFITNTSGTSVRVDFRDATSGSVVFSLFVAAGGGGAVIVPPVPLKQTTAANNWTAQLSAAVTDVRIFVQGVKNV